VRAGHADPAASRQGACVSQYENSHDDTPRFEPWLAVMLSSLVPEIVAIYLPPWFFIPAVVLTVALFLTGLVMLRRQTLRRRLQAADATTSHPRPASEGLAPTTYLDLEAQ
jgi:hypothetical protein